MEPFARRPHQRLSRAFVKTFGYRIVMLAVTVVVALFVLGDAGEALSIGLLANAVKTGTYFCYERAWDHVEWGI